MPDAAMFRTAEKKQRYGWIPDLPDHRDFRYAVVMKVPAVLPKRAGLRRLCPPVSIIVTALNKDRDVSQGGSCSCDGNGWYYFLNLSRFQI